MIIEANDIISKLDISIKSWYMDSYPKDVIGKTLSPTASFLDLNNLLNSGRGTEVYRLLGGEADTVIRERCFEKLSELTNQEYNVIYEKWINFEKNNEIEEEIEK